MRRTILLGSLLCACTTVGVDDAQPPATKSDGKAQQEAPVQPQPQPETPVEAEPLDDDTAAAMATGLNAFSLDFYAKQRSMPGNTVMSPASVAMALSLVHAGAKGDTEKEIGKALQLGGSQDEAAQKMGGLLARWNGEHEAFQLAVANRLFGEKTVAYEKPYLAEVQRVFAAPLESMDFKGDAEKSRVRINDWVAEQTKDKIRDLLPPMSINSATRLALVNAVYFKSQWMFPFEENMTRDGDFHVAKAKAKTAKMMSQTSYFDHAVYADDGVAALQMPYEGREFAMVVLLPTKKDGLEALEASLDTKHWDKWVGGLSGKRVMVQMPKFEIEPAEAMLLSPVLKAMGIEKMFDPGAADLTGIAPAKEQLFISEGYHKGFIKVDESGTEAAAATAMVAVAGAAPSSEPPPSFIADHPFVYAIRDVKTGSILFIGRVADPS